MTGQGTEKESVFIWAWVGLVLVTFGLIVLGTGLVQCSRPPDTVLGNLHPRIWWGGIMAFTGLVFVALDLSTLFRR